MSAEEKRKCILGIYHKTKLVYTEKEIIALATKAGVNQNTVADINQSLVDDGLVDKEKIGGSNYFWSFPGKQDRMMQLEHTKTLGMIEELKVKITEAEARLADAKRGREEEIDDDNDGKESSVDNHNEASRKKMKRSDKLKKLAELEKKKKEMSDELNKLKENDPQAMADLKHELKLCKEAANRWTDNIFECKSYLVKKRGIDKKQAMKMIGITDSFDCE